MYAYWIQIELISLIIAFKLVRKYLLTPGKKVSMHAKLWTVIVSTWWHKCSLSIECKVPKIYIRQKSHSIIEQMIPSDSLV